MAAQICETCRHKSERCYCAPNSTCEGYEPEISEIDINLEEKLVQLRKMVQAMYIPNLMDASDGALSKARMQKNEIVQYINQLVRVLREEV
jgi:hypothetical protein